MPSTDLVAQFEYLYGFVTGHSRRPPRWRPTRSWTRAPWRIAIFDRRSSTSSTWSGAGASACRVRRPDAWDVTLEPDDYPDVPAIADQWQRDEAETLTWLSELTEAELAAAVTVNGLEGFPLLTYLVHVVMHGVESFSAAAILLHRAGHSMGDVGFLDFVDATGPST